MAGKKIRSKSPLIRRTTVSLSKLKAAASATFLTFADSVPLGGAPPTWQRVLCPIPRQEQTNWCWCATTLGVHKLFNSADTTTQCQAANRILGRTDACGNPSDQAINKPYLLDQAFAAFGHLRAPIVGTPLSPGQIDAEMLTGKPVGTRIGWSGGGGHFMVVEGYLADATPRVAINDPIFGRSDIDYSLYVTSYQGTGSWTHSYLIQ